MREIRAKERTPLAMELRPLQSRSAAEETAVDDAGEEKNEEHNTRVAIIVKIGICFCVFKACQKRYQVNGGFKQTGTPAKQFMTLTMDKFLNDMEREKPIRFTDQQLRIATDNYSYHLGSGGFGSVYKGSFSNGTIIAVKVLRGSSDKIIDAQFMAEVGTIGKVHHFNLVRLYGFCFERHLRALVYEYMVNGPLEKYLFHESTFLSFEKLHEIAIGTARGIAYLHEECQQRIIHYDIKPGNILLDRNFCPKVADFGLAKLCNRDHTHITMTGGRGTPGYAAPELWLPFPVTHKCDVYSFGMLLFEIIGRRKNHNINLPESQVWFPMWAWEKFAAEKVGELITSCGIDDKDREIAERIVKVALSCVQYKPEVRPIMSVVVKMLEGSVEVPNPPNPFQYLIGWVPPTHDTDTNISSDSSLVTKSVPVLATHAITTDEIELASV
ncbi:rust resistance kinase Lr10 isoform X2 [Vigna angularis]|uniref:rust resistance kinase Lr10 isoform X2 n=1 Tax=Phaseolus angularis TaxID=3914 RepID=UPI0022B57FD4|nr:rust resistance kinase Lr10 isoform X2 [Vigna angularis]